MIFFPVFKKVIGHTFSAVVQVIIKTFRARKHTFSSLKHKTLIETKSEEIQKGQVLNFPLKENKANSIVIPICKIKTELVNVQ